MTEAYRITIEEPLQIPAAVYETRQRVEDDEVHVLLDHQEDENVVRGYAEDRDTGIRRPDGGLSWYHHGTGCYMKAFPTDRFRAVREVQHDWIDDLTDLIDEEGTYSSDEIICHSGDPDLYRDTGEQLIGTSSYQSQDVTVVRSCWYEDDPQSEQLDELLERDGIDPATFYSAIEPVELLETIDQRIGATAVDADDFISAESMEKAEQLQEPDGGGISGSCVLTDYDDLR